MNSVNCTKDKRFAAGIVPGYAQPFVFLVIYAGKEYTLLNITARGIYHDRTAHSPTFP